MVSLPEGELQNTRATAILANVQSTSTSSHPSTAIEALSPPGSSFQASHQDALIHLRPNTAPRFEHKRVYRNPCTKGIGVDPWAGRTAWVTALRRSPSCSVLRTAECTGVAFAQPGRISRSHRLRYRTLALVAAVLPGSWASLPIAGRRIEKVSGTNGTLVVVMSLALAGRCLFPCRPSEYKKKGRPVHLRARHGHRDHLRSLPVASRPTSVLLGTWGSDNKQKPLASSPRPLSAGDHAPHRPLYWTDPCRSTTLVKTKALKNNYRQPEWERGRQ